MVYQVKDPALIGKLYLGLGRVDVYIHAAQAQIQVQDAGRIAPGEQGVFVSLLQSGLQQLGLDETAVAEEILGGPVAPPRGGGGHEAGDLHPLVLAPAGQQGGGQLPAQQGVGAGVLPPVAGGEELLAAVPDQAHGDLRPSQGAAQRGLHAGGGFAPVGFQELEPGGGVVKQIPHDHGGTLRAAHRSHLVDLPGGEGHQGALVVAPAAGAQLDVGHGGDGGQSLTPEAHGADGLQPPLVPELGGGVAQESDPGVLGGHAAAVVGDADIGHAAPADLHGDVPGAGVKGVLHQLLDDGGGPLHHLARGDQIRHMGRQNIDNRHMITSLAIPDGEGYYT